PIMKIYVGVQPWLVIGDPYLAHEILAVNGNITSNRPYLTFSHKFYAPNQRGVLFPNPNNNWKKTRAAVLRMFSSKATALERFRIHELEADALINRILTSTAKNSEKNGIDLLPEFQLVFANVILTLVYSKRVSSIDDPIFKTLASIMTHGLDNVDIKKELKVFLPIFSILDYIFSHSGMKWCVQDLANPLYLRLIKEALENGDSNCFVKQLKQMQHVDDDELLVTVSDLAIAGTDTPAIELMWTILILCRYQDAQRVLRDEVDTFIVKHKRLPAFNDREELPHLISTQKECMRYRPPIFFGLTHETSKDLTCRGYFIPQGTVIASNMRGMHMNPDIYEEPEKFIQDRFTHKSNKPLSALANGPIQERDQFSYGWGRRLCPGAHLAEVQIFTVLVRLVAKLKIEPKVDRHGNTFFPDLDKHQETGVMVMPTDRIVRIVKREDALL
ncbi:hypothetical protein INT45_003254, partial [Circinella minor]